MMNKEVLQRIQNLELAARNTVEGMMIGSHRSRQHGFAVEFAEHREYVPGDDIRHIDWKVYGRKERFYLKQYELETDLVCWLLVDSSESMKFGSTSLSKYQLASTAAAALGLLTIRQTDAMGLGTFDHQLRSFIKSGSHVPHWKDCLRVLVEHPSEYHSQIGQVLHEFANRLSRRGIVAIFSDFFDEPDDIFLGLKHLQHQRHEVIIFHVLDAAEIEFPYRQTTLFQGMEQAAELLTDPLSIRESYLQEFQRFTRTLQSGCRDLGIDYVLLRTDDDLGKQLSKYLSGRAMR
ncbi:MAG: DUF58 domain-containing protein [Zavarzinella sp.]